MEKLYVLKGEKVLYNNKACIIIRLVDISTVSIQEIDTGIIHTVSVNSISIFTNKKEEIIKNELHALTDEKWNKAKFRYSIIKELLLKNRSLEKVKNVSRENDVSVPTLYRWIKLYEETGLVSSLAGRISHGGTGKSRLPEGLDDIINDKIHSVYLTTSRKSIVKTIREVKIACSDLGIEAPHENTIRNRIKNISEEERVRKRFGAQEARYKFEPLKGSFPGADFPLSVVQIDHTPVDIILVDEEFRKAYRRPWLTVAIDVYSRMVLGFYLSYETPGALGTGICIANAILPKESWLESVGVKTDWPCWGIMDTIHVDNAKEFRGNMLRKACENYSINIQFRPLGAPHWGGHVERLLGTFSKEIHDLPGTTFSNVAERKRYQSEKNASFTLTEIEKWLTQYITNIYHKRVHSAIKQTPLSRFKEGIMGDSKLPGRGIPPRIFNEIKTRIDFLPIVERTVQEYGIVIDHIFYYDDVLRSYIHDTDDKRNKVKHIFKRDPRDISYVYFFDPHNNDYIKIPYRDASLPPISIWEYRDLLKTLKKNSIPVDEESIFSAYRELADIESRAVRETKKIRRNTNTESRRVKLEKEQISEVDYKEDNLLDAEEIIIPFEDIDDEALN